MKSETIAAITLTVLGIMFIAIIIGPQPQPTPIKAAITNQPAVNIDDLPYDKDWPLTLSYIKAKESQGATADQLRTPGVAGELGPYQITPIFCDDHKRRTGNELNIFNPPNVHISIMLYIEHYAPSRNITTIGEAYDLYRLGPTGYDAKKQRR